MRKTNWMAMLTVVIAVVFVMCLVTTSLRADDGATLFKAKCVMCHAADGSGSPAGKKMGAHDFSTPEVQKMTDAELTDIIGKGKNKMPGYTAKGLKDTDIKALVAFIRTLKK